MCVTDVYVDVYPDNRAVEFRRLSICRYGNGTRPCESHSEVAHPVRKINYNELTTQYILSSSPPTYGYQTALPSPPRSPPRTYRRRSSFSPDLSEDRLRRHHSYHTHKRSSLLLPSKAFQHRKERIVIVDAPPTPRTPPQRYARTLTAPSSPVTPPYTPGERPIIVDERPLRRLTRSDSNEAVVTSPKRKKRSPSRVRFEDSPRTSFESRSSRDERREWRVETEDESDSERRRERRRQRRMAEEDAEIRRRPAVPFKLKSILKPVVNQSDRLQGMMGALTLAEKKDDERDVGLGVEFQREERGERVILEGKERRRSEKRDDEVWRRREWEDDEAMDTRLKERQRPRRRVSIAAPWRRTRVNYDDGFYRYD
ncbi:hypothetical protein B7494_g3963 [Chlorociboria aeruginascens]|nr:hypothetical protein B7494_g3963 [Chlorociboria aeruginascens]